MPGRTDSRASRHGTQIWFSLERRRTRSDEAHLAQQDVQELRDLVQVRGPQEPADPGDARITVDFEMRAVGVIERY